MFGLSRPSLAEIAGQIERASKSAACPRILARTKGLMGQLPPQFAHDHSRSCVGLGYSGFAASRRAFADWKMFDLGWVRVANPLATIAIGEVVAVEARSLGLWSLNLSRIVETIDLPNQFGFMYTTTEIHVEWGEERFLVEFDPSTEEVWYELEAVSRPRHWLARFAFPISRAFQRRFAEDSHRRMREAVSSTLNARS